MASVEFIIGGAGSGKTREIITRLAERYRAEPFAGALVLVPTIRHADQFRRRLVQECGVALNLRVETLAMFGRGLAAGAPIMSASTATDTLSRVARRTVGQGGNAAYFQPIAGTPGFVSMIDAAVGSLLEEHIDADALRTAAGKLDDILPIRALSRIYAAYTAELARRHVVHPLQVNGVAAERVGSAEGVPDSVMVDGFLRFTEDEKRLLFALAERAHVTIGFDPDGTARSRTDVERLQSEWPAASMMTLDAPQSQAAWTKSEASNPEQHVREIARHIKRLLADDPTLKPSDCAVTFRQATPYLALMRRVFDEYDIPFDPAAGGKLGDSALGTWLNRLLGIKDNGWRATDLTGILRSGLVNVGRWGIMPSDVDALPHLARQNKMWSGLETLERLAALAAPGFADALNDVRQLIDDLESGSVDPTRRLIDALYGDRGWLQNGSGIDDEAAHSIDQLRAFLEEMARSTPVEGGEDGEAIEPFERFRERLNRRLAMPILVRRTAGGVLLAPMHTMHGLRFRHVMVGGLSEGEFPASRRYGELLTDDVRERLNEAGLPLPVAPRATEEELWESATSRATDATNLWRYRINGAGKEAPPAWEFQKIPAETVRRIDAQTAAESASQRELAIACTRGWLEQHAFRPASERGVAAPAWDVVRIAASVEQVRRSFAFAGEYEGHVSSGLASRMTREGARWSASALDAYLTCSFQFFGNRILNLKELDEETDGADAAMRGTIVHAILEQALSHLVEQRLPLNDDTLTGVIARIDTDGRALWEQAPEAFHFGQAELWKLEWKRYRDRIVKMLEDQAPYASDTEDFRVLAVEYPFEVEIPTNPPLTIRGTIDRIDDSPYGLTLLDYKTGSIPTKKKVREGESIQLPLYALAMKDDPAAQGKPVRMEYSKLPAPGDARPWALDTSLSEDAELVENVIAILQKSRDSIEAGDFRVNPTPVSCPTYCAMKHVCRVNTFSRYKQ